MITVIVVDDEKVIREGIGRFVKETDGFELLDICENGKAAYEKISFMNPDLVICDIMMPVCDGLELIKKCRETNVESEFVLLSGYSEFEYAQQAIRFGVLDYVNKPINQNVFRQLLETAKEAIENKNKVKKTLQSRLLEKVIEEKELGRLEEEQYLAECEKNYRVLVVNAVFGSSWEKIRENNKVILQFCEKILEKEFVKEYMVYEKEGIIVLILKDKDIRIEWIIEICEQIQSCAKGKGMNCYIGAGNLVESMKEIPISYRQAKAAMYEASNRKEELSFFDRLSYPYMNPKKIYGKNMLDISNAIYLNDEEEIRNRVKNCIEEYKVFAPFYVIYSFILEVAKEITERFSFQKDGIKIKQEEIAKLSTAENIETLVIRFEELIQRLFKEITREQKQGGTIDEILKYILLHYTEEISIKKICSIFYFNESYFSVFFKTKTGQNYNDFITDLRIKKAEELLKYGKYRINEIAQLVGYNSSRYFSRVFELKTGELPTEYRARYLKK